MLFINILHMSLEIDKIIEEKCPAMNLFHKLSKMWILPILVHVSNGQKYFSSIKNNLNWMSSRTLSLRLKELQKDNFILREIVSEQPLRIEYSLTEKWKSFSKELDHLSKWAKKWW